ncbi:putative disease resistance RPP13-like protein 1 [Lycium barbarum]|uniref:putative disease resistance RPP13-like protein 1 n=1 Tax=Lycium barbarum TaxID=112863 RepID=UPI00293E086F|nr:putative disease resistance RPP13-like protein 1 [Lycium barbarum]XP_060169440.1 putative disease resistance RPP13-like protein 1 [Lycium barbarum]XP_060169441.1 putative disease resistance RPP13-like protein 1 [Lycium barbarum]XP_060169443.1 putative disease resistance RPP13-like protein 1 [Lycium barbarum]XP_060169444.1 putative disease resistance RPP13-like protein 1 [Lycium barbarum]XP_060169445.1 putative disease resistance RPP13-like protein 1 [Lycium barbarum]XP_060169446.1 putative
MAGLDIGLAVGGAFLSSALNVLFDRLAPQGELFKMFQKHKDEDGVQLLEKLEDILVGLQSVLSDAENKQASNRSVSRWFNKLQYAVDGAENLIEEVNYEALRLKVESQHQNIAEGISNLQVSDLHLGLSDEFFRNIRRKLEYTYGKLKVLQEQIGDLHLTKNLDSGNQGKRESSTSLVDESDIFGRQSEIKELVDHLLSEDANGKNLTVVPIVGMGGVGKTTLAQAVYNDKKVEKHFDLKAWVCVSESYDASRITKELLQEIESFDLKDDNNLDKLKVKLKEKLTGKRFLVVLDDVWNDNYNEWDELRKIFVQGKIGSKIIVTTRKGGVALMMGRGEINVGTLSSEVSWSLFKRHAFQNIDPKEHPQLEEVGKKIAAKCNGLPLALKTLAGMLRSKSEVKEWEYILRSEIWELQSRSNGILPALWLSYNDLPAHLKQCFAYCAIYPKGYQFSKDQVIHLWIANRLVQHLDSGEKDFLDLRSRSLFERVLVSSKWNLERFLMHDLVNDVAQIASSKGCIRLEDNEGSHVLGKSRHLSYSMGFDGEFEKLKPLCNLEQLRTLLPINIHPSNPFFNLMGPHSSMSKRVLHNILPTLRSLRALSLSRYNNRELPNVLFIKLKLLRYLDLSWTVIRKLPDSICALYNLETLLLSHCSCLKELPPQMERLINLRHLDISCTSRLKMPLHLSKLKSLHMLVGAKCCIGGSSGSKIENLGTLHNLYGSLSILELENVVDRTEALKAKMREKEHVDMLSLEWSEINAADSQIEKAILEKLHPHTNIKKLQIAGYRGTNFPYWLADHSFLKLVEFSLSNCKDCYSLPPLGQLPSLKFLAIREMHQITDVTEEFYGSSSSKKPFNSLEKLEFAKMWNWKQWHVLGKGEFPLLRELSIDYCPMLIGKLPDNLCSLTTLRISKCPELNLETPIQLSSQLLGMKQIVHLNIEDCQSLTSLPISILSNTLKTIGIYNCGKLKLEASVGEMISIGNCNMFLERLSLCGCDSIDDISHEWVPRARHLWVTNFHSLKRLLIPTGTETLNIGKCENFKRLTVACETQMTSLYIYECEKVKWLPERMQELLPSLKRLNLHDCPEIESFPEGGLPFNLEVLVIYHCKKLVNGRKEWRLQRLPCLRELQIFHDGSDEEILVGENWELPCSIRRLIISNLKTLSSQVLKSLTSLEFLDTSNLPQIQSLLEEGLPSSLSELILHKHDELHSLPMEGLLRLTSLQCLQIWYCPNLQSIPKSALPSSLFELTIWDCPNLQSIPESALPSSLSMLTITNCPNLQSIPESTLPSSLSELDIYNCPNLQSLPVKGMPSSLSKLSISRCPLLKPLLEFDKGEYWPNIAHIPTICNEEYL